MFEYDKHYRDCTQNNQPFIKARINPANQNYYVQIDLLTCDYRFSKEGLRHLTKSFEDEKTCQKNGNFIDYSVGDELSWIDGVAPKHLEQFCDNIYELSQKYHQQLKSD